MRLIDADNLRDIFKYETCLFEPNDVLDYIDSECTIDAVEVVRCENCQYYELLGNAILTDAVRGICTYRPMAYGVKDNDFCSYGERKGDVENERMDQRKR